MQAKFDVTNGSGAGMPFLTLNDGNSLAMGDVDGDGTAEIFVILFDRTFIFFGNTSRQNADYRQTSVQGGGEKGVFHPPPRQEVAFEVALPGTYKYPTRPFSLPFHPLT